MRPAHKRKRGTFFSDSLKMNSQTKRNNSFHEEDEAENVSGEQEQENEGFSCKYCEFATQDIDVLDEHIVTSHDEALLEDDDGLDEEFFEICEGEDLTEDINNEAELDSQDECGDDEDQNPKFSISNLAETKLSWRGRKPKQRLPAFFEEYAHKPNKKVFVCPFCGYQSMKKSDLNKHLTGHTQPVELPIYACAECTYTTRRKCDMSKHLLTHCENDTVPMYKCDQCQYATKRKGDLSKHVLCHRKPTTLYKCSECSYSSKRHGDLKKHLSCHDTPNATKDGSIYNCTECGYTSKRLNDLHKHVVLHCDRAYKGLFKCLKCDYMCAAGSHFAKHVLSHCRTREMAITEFAEDSSTGNVVYLEEMVYSPEVDEEYVPQKQTRGKRKRNIRTGNNGDILKKAYYSADNQLDDQQDVDKVIVLSGYEENEQIEG